MALIIGQERIAEVFGVAPKTIVEWQEQGFPVALRGGPGVPSEFESADCIRWFVDREITRLNLERPRDRMYRLQADTAELNLRKLRGELAPLVEVQRILSAAIIDARELLLHEPRRLAMLLDGLDRAQREHVLEETFIDFLTRLATWRPAGQAVASGDQPEGE